MQAEQRRQEVENFVSMSIKVQHPEIIPTSIKPARPKPFNLGELRLGIGKDL